MKTPYGLRFLVLNAKELERFSGYDRAVAQCHIANCGSIIVYENNPSEPIDDEYDLDAIYNTLNA